MIQAWDADDSDRLEALLDRMRDGDREAAARFLSHYGSRLRRRIRGKLQNSRMRRLFDSQEILSTLNRRLDACVRERSLHAEGSGQFWSFMDTMIANAVVDKARIYRKLHEAEGDETFVERSPDPRTTRRGVHTLDPRLEDALEQAVASIRDPVDREILLLRTQDCSHEEIATMLGRTADSIRQRWFRLRAELRSRLTLLGA